ncbi:hypothetical protein NKR19_g4417 [Coniochaeta hoffmannii]|uniref:DUF2423 domain-containing protein n=1 Tax=Coniochaeta hoffmannii TaxID=91930 RepID=A0AA38SC98_9PEZI|nr:hypothetical protein NKR19_g4417 [Coniochaeta hoffmannii]
MAKSARASKVKSNNQRLKKNVFGPVEAARTERLSAKLQELISQPKPSEAKKEVEMQDVDAEDVADKASTANADDTMEVDSGASKPQTKRRKGASVGRKGIEKRKAKKSAIVFPTRHRKKAPAKKSST